MLSRENWVCLNGTFIKEADAFVPITDRGFLFGDGLFTTARVHQGNVEFLQDHLQRLYHQCLQLNIQPPFIELEWIQMLIEHNQAREGTWRLKIVITAGNTPSLGLPQRLAGTILLTLKPYESEAFTPIRLGLFPSPLMGPHTSLKTLAYLDRLFVKDYAQRNGYDDVLVCSHEGYLIETSFSNLFWIISDSLFIPDPAFAHLQGILLAQIMIDFKAKVEKVKVKWEDIPPEAAVYTCNALTHIRSVIEINHRRFYRQIKQEKKLQEMLIHALKQKVTDKAE